MKDAGTVFPRLAGGLGNQMFQIAAAIGLANRLGCEWAVPRDGGEIYGQGRLPQCYRENLYRYLPFRQPGASLQLRERRTAYHWLRVPRLKTDWTMAGYWQSPRYWEHCAAEVRAAFDLSWWDGGESLERLRRASGKPLCAIHYRGGDYLRYPGKHAVCGGTYFRRALAALREEYLIVLFTDDVESARREGVPHDHHFATGDDALDFAAMAHCDAGIISNSTFAWWAMVLGTTKREIHAPDRWFGPQGPTDFHSIYPKEWILHSTTTTDTFDSTCLP